MPDCQSYRIAASYKVEAAPGLRVLKLFCKMLFLGLFGSEMLFNLTSMTEWVAYFSLSLKMETRKWSNRNIVFNFPSTDISWLMQILEKKNRFWDNSQLKKTMH